MPDVFAALAAAERAITQAVLEAYRTWLAAVRGSVLAPYNRFRLAPDPNGVFAASPLWQSNVERFLRDLRGVARRGWTDAVEDLGEHLPFDHQSSILTEQLQQTRNLMVRTPDEVYRRVIAELAKGGSIDQQADRVRQLLDITGTENWESRAKTVASTECLPGDAIVNGAHITAAYRRWYEGDFITVITENGNQFRGTPNHPVLTTRGWVGLGSLLEGDCLVCDSLEVNDAGASPYPDVEAGPSSIAEVFDSLQAVGVMSRIAGGQPDFHGDGLDGNVDVLCANGFLPYGDFAQICQHRIDLSLEPATLSQALLAAQGAPFSYLGSAEDEAPGRWGDAFPIEDPGYGVPAAPESFGQVLHAATQAVFSQYVVGSNTIRDRLRVGGDSLLVSGDTGFAQDGVDGIDGDVDAAGDDSHGDARPVFTDNVVRIFTSNFSGHVYNLSAVQGYFVAQGVFTGNTHRAYAFGGLAAAQRLQLRIGVIFKRWDSRMDANVRNGHRAANDQIRPLNQPFQVSGEYLMMPLDPSGSASNVINCRCVARFSRSR